MNFVFCRCLWKIQERLARDDIIARLWESDAFIDDNTLTVNVARLRKKLENVGMEGRIKTKKGIGYYLDK